MVRARNKYGWGSFSPVSTIISATIPSTPAAVTTTQSTTYVKIAWTAPSTNGLAITAYDIQIQESDLSTYASSLTYCDGTSSTVISNAYCLIPFTTLTASPFSLTYGKVVYAKVRAYNAIGWSSYSTINTSGATIKTVPLAPPNAIT
jgi:hypothetical protein